MYLYQSLVEAENQVFERIGSCRIELYEKEIDQNCLQRMVFKVI